MSTPVTGSLETTSTMKVSCSAKDKYIANMLIDNIGAQENDATPPPQTVTINAECNSADMVWYYVTTVNGETVKKSMSSISCTQSTCSAKSLTYGVGDDLQPQQMIDVSYTE